MLSDNKWDYEFNLTYSVTLSQDSLETSLVVRNTGSSNYDFQVLFHSYLAIDVSEVHTHRAVTRGTVLIMLGTGHWRNYRLGTRRGGVQGQGAGRQRCRAGRATDLDHI